MSTVRLEINFQELTNGIVAEQALELMQQSLANLLMFIRLALTNVRHGNDVELTIDWFNIGAMGRDAPFLIMKEIAELRELSDFKLSALIINKCNIMHDFGANWAQAFALMPYELDILDLSSNAFLHALGPAQNASFKVNAQIFCKNLISLFDAIESRPRSYGYEKLISLYLCDNDIGGFPLDVMTLDNRNVPYIIEVFNHLPTTLESIDLCHNSLHILQDSIIHLFKAIRLRCPKLREVYLAADEIFGLPVATMHELFESFAGLKIVLYDVDVQKDPRDWIEILAIGAFKFELLDKEGWQSIVKTILRPMINYQPIGDEHQKEAAQQKLEAALEKFDIIPLEELRDKTLIRFANDILKKVAGTDAKYSFDNVTNVEARFLQETIMVLHNRGLDFTIITEFNAYADIVNECLKRIANTFCVTPSTDNSSTATGVVETGSETEIEIESAASTEASVVHDSAKRCKMQP